MAADRMLALLPTAAILLDGEDNVRMANVAAISMGIVRGQQLDVTALTQLVRSVRRTGDAQTVEFVIDQGGFPRRALSVGARAQPLDDGEVALVVDDLTESKRVDAVRRDFVANVGHEIKTPVGALTLLAEAALEARDDPDAVHHFLSRMQREANRLSRLVQELLDLSRLQGGETPPASGDVSVDAVVDEAVDRGRLVAEVKQIEIVRGGDSGCLVVGSENQLVTAVSNLLDNAVAYSPERTEVAVGVHRRGDMVEIAVKDQGIGIDAVDQERIFERFYRVDPARSRDTGGTGLGLAIVKHIVSNHRGQITVWSQPGAGSTFTLRLPASTTAPGAPSPTDGHPRTEASPA
ncbi:MAG: two-component system, OmpR family, sensor histidine kinase SenX3 [Frankiaceae bacterium]|jgi:two-component system sensor histidine kinase SenX3|nr:two-component system, OmpR family, sensor histidine kinase SenX3 [Frankiaceae bacterium]